MALFGTLDVELQQCDQHKIIKLSTTFVKYEKNMLNINRISCYLKPIFCCVLILVCIPVCIRAHSLTKFIDILINNSTVQYYFSMSYTG